MIRHLAEKGFAVCGAPRAFTAGQKLLLLAKVADLLEQDRHAYYPDEPPVIVGTFEEALLDLITQK